MKTCYLVLESGERFPGYRFGAEASFTAEISVNRAVGGYMGTLSDPQLSGRIVLETFPVIGNYGVIREEMQSERCMVKGYVVRELCATPVNFRSEGALDSFLKEQGVAGVCGVDTRQIARILQMRGPMRASIMDDEKGQVNA